MAEHEAIKLFEENKMRVFFDDLEEQWYFCINDVVQVLTDSKDPSDYFKKMRRRDHELDDFVRGTICPPPPICFFRWQIACSQMCFFERYTAHHSDYIAPKDELPFKKDK